MPWANSGTDLNAETVIIDALLLMFLLRLVLVECPGSQGASIAADPFMGLVGPDPSRPLSIRRVDGREFIADPGRCCDFLWGGRDEFRQTKTGCPRSKRREARRGLTQQRFWPGEGCLNRIEVGAVGREIETCLDRRAQACAFTVAEIVNDDDIAALQFRNESLIDIGLEGLTVDRPIENHW
jgi:hypothetical protein